jgi:hypothetical protein
MYVEKARREQRSPRRRRFSNGTHGRAWIPIVCDTLSCATVFTLSYIGKRARGLFVIIYYCTTLLVRFHLGPVLGHGSMSMSRERDLPPYAP